MTQIGPFFYIRGKLIFNACSLTEGREQAGKLDNSYGHDQLYDDHFKTGEFIDYPRGRALWDKEKNHSIIYIDPCINREDVLPQIIAAFAIGDYVVEYGCPEQNALSESLRHLCFTMSLYLLTTKRKESSRN